jgi:hypothetical protein
MAITLTIKNMCVRPLGTVNSCQLLLEREGVENAYCAGNRAGM